MGWIQAWWLRAREFQWERGVRAGVAVGSAMVVTHEFGRPFGWAAFGAFMAILVDNGGPYRTRLLTMVTALGGGAIAAMLGALIGSGTLLPAWIGAIMAATAVVCFVVTYARVVAQPLASTSVMMLVTYFAGLGGSQHTFAAARAGAGMLLLGGLWAAGLSLALWPLDPFRPARLAVAMCYASLAEFTLGLGQSLPDDPEKWEHDAQAWKRKQRAWIEQARAALVATPARAPSRTVRARNLTVLLETADMLYATTIRLTEVVELASGSKGARTRLVEIASLLGEAERAIGKGLQRRPADGAASFAPGGSYRLDLERRRALGKNAAPGGALEQHLVREEQDAALELEICFEAVRGLWNGVDAQAARAWAAVRQESGGSGWLGLGWMDEVKANWTLESVMMRHALRLAVVGAVDVGLMHLIQLNHGYWLAMTSIIVMQPGGLGTVRKGMQRVGGTVAGGILAAGLAATMHSQEAIIAVIVVTSALTLATYAIDYGLYCFFLTPTFVLMSLPHLRDWHYAGIRMGTTVAGALVAMVAMRLLWHEHAAPELSRLLARGAAADASYLRAVLRFWEMPATLRREGQRNVLAPARRTCGLSSNEAEEALDRMMLEPGGWREWSKIEEGERNAKEQALRFATYLRRLTQSTTTVAMLGRGTRSSVRRLAGLAERLEVLANGLGSGQVATEEEPTVKGPAMVDVVEDQMQRMERQVGVLERTAAALAGATAVPNVAETIVVG